MSTQEADGVEQQISNDITCSADMGVGTRTPSEYERSEGTVDACEKADQQTGGAMQDSIMYNSVVNLRELGAGKDLKYRVAVGDCEKVGQDMLRR